MSGYCRSCQEHQDKCDECGRNVCGCYDCGCYTDEWAMDWDWEAR